METEPPFMYHVMAAYKVTEASKELAGTVVESDSDVTDYKPQAPSTPDMKPLSSKKSEIEHVPPDLRVETRTYIEGIVGNRLTK